MRALRRSIFVAGASPQKNFAAASATKPLPQLYIKRRRKKRAAICGCSDRQEPPEPNVLLFAEWFVILQKGK